MAGNPVPNDESVVIAMAEDAADGLHQLEALLGITSITEAKLRADILAYHAANNVAGAAKQAKQAASATLQTADAAASDFIMSARNVLSNTLGQRWNSEWEPTGFPDQSLALPRTQEKRMNLCAALKTYYTANPTQEVAALNLTAAKADEHYKAISDGRELQDQKFTAQGQMLKARDATVQATAKHLRTLITDLDSYLPEDDDRWHTFGLNAPADPVTPENVVSLTLTNGLAHQIVAAWPRAPRATRYRPFVQIVGVDADPIARDPVHDLTVTLDSFTSGQTVKVYITAANDDGEANPSPTVQILVP